VTVPARKETRGGVRYGDEGENREPTAVPGKEGRTVQGSEASAAPCRGHASVAHVGLATDGFRRTQSDSDPASVARSPGIGAMSNRVCQLLHTTYGYPFLGALLFLLFPLNPTCTSLSYRLRSGHTCFFQNPAISVTIVRALLHQPVVDFPLEHTDIFTKENVYSKGGTVV
jgi:hypothetical protein